MKERRYALHLAAFVLFTLALPFTPIISSADFGKSLNFIPGEVIVQVTDPQAPITRGAPGRIIRHVRKITPKTWLVGLRRGETVERAIEELKNQPGVKTVQPNYIYRPCLVPNDPYFPEQWALRNEGQVILGIAGTAGADISAEEAWDVTTGSQDVIVAVIDTGVAYDHPDLSQSMWRNQGETPNNGIDDDGNGYVDDVIGWDFADDDNDPWDPNGHGTHVAGIIGAGMNNGIGTVGVSPDVRIMALKVGGVTGYFTTDTIIEAINYAASMNARIINASWGGTSYDPALESAITEAGKKGVLFVAAAGNNGLNNDYTPFYPASFALANIISVAATNQNDELASFSNFGIESVDVAAPGVGILSSFSESEPIWFDDFESGTLNGWFTGGAGEKWGTDDSTAYANSTFSLSDSPGGDYSPDTRSYAGHNVDLTGRRGAVLTGFITGISSPEDQLFIQTSKDGNIWLSEEIEISNGNSTLEKYISGNMNQTWYRFRVDLGNLDYTNGSFRFFFTTDSSTQSTDDGWYTDDLEVTAGITPSETTFYYMSGTSMSAPIVSGIAALIVSKRPELTPEQVKTLIVLSCDKTDSLSDRVGCGGRVNAYRALTSHLPPTPSGGGGCSVNPAVQPRNTSLAVMAVLIFLVPFLLGRYRRRSR